MEDFSELALVMSPVPLTSMGRIQSHGWLTANCKESQEKESGCVPREERQWILMNRWPSQAQIRSCHSFA